MKKFHSLQALSRFAGALLPMIALVIATGFGASSARADINTINKSIWGMHFGVTASQIADTNWLAADSDGDGLKNSDEVAAGTNPFAAGSVVAVNSITADATTVSLSFTSAEFKQYVLQGSPNLNNASFTNISGPVTGSGGTLDFNGITKGTNKFFRVLVQDIDTDSDGVSDWAEEIAGYNPNSAMTNGVTPDGTAMANAIAESNVVSVSVMKSSATQPADGTEPLETGAIRITRSGTLRFNAITVPLQISGTALEGTDYDNLPHFVTFTPPEVNGATDSGLSEIVLTVNPKYNSNRKTNVTAIVKVMAGGGYALGAATTGAVVINPTDIEGGSGLTGKYYANASINYTSGNNFGVTNPSELLLTRTDSTIDFTSPYNATTNPTGWDTPALSTTRPITTNTGVYSIRWTGQVLPQYSETYSFDLRSREGGKVWVNGRLLIDKWTTQAATDNINTIALKAGVLYDIKVEYFSAGAAPEARLYWWSLSRPKQIIPSERLFPDPGQSSKQTAITSSLAAVGYEGVPFSFRVISPNISGTTTYAMAATSGPLPPGLTISSAGLITGTPTMSGTYNVAVNATNTAAAAVTGSSVIDFTIYPSGSVSRETLVGSAVTANGTIPALDDETDYPNNTSRRLRGYMIPPKTGNYYFWLAANNTAELWIANDSEFINRVQRAVVTASTGKKIWSTSPTQRSGWLTLVAGQRYYFDVLHNTGTDADDYVSVGWCQDDVGTVIATSANPNPTGVLTTIPDGGGPLQGYPLSGTVPGYLCQPYDYPAVTPSTGTLYAANMGPQSTASTSGSGAANLRVNAAQTQGILYFDYQNLTTAKTAYHLHVDGYTSSVALGSTVHPQGEIIYDIDDIDAFHPELMTADGGYIWNFEPVGSFTSVAQIREAIQIGKVYLNVHTVTYPGGEIRGTLTLVEGSQTPPDASQYPAPSFTNDSGTDAGAARFLNQATFGASPTDVSYVKANGFTAWINDQLTKTPSRSSSDVVAGITSDINQPYPSRLFTDAWWKYSITGQDQLRQRLAFALSEILVVSWANDSGPLAFNGRILADYYDNLVDYCLPTDGVANSGNFRGILKAVTLTPAMGLYLDMRANEKGDDSIGRHPNENYAREIMQLFSVGINRTWDDGTFVLDKAAAIVPTYIQPTIIGLSNLLTGWNYAQANQGNGRAPTNFGPGADYLNPMVLVPTRHELTAKLLLNNVMSPPASGLTPRVNISGVAIGSPCSITTATAHGLSTGDTIVIAGVSSGSFTGGFTAINTAFQATVTSATTFTVPVNCATAAGAAGTVTGSTVTPVAFGTAGVVAVTGSQADSTNFSGWTLPHPYDQYGLNELDAAINNIVANDNVPPYICRQLIQRLVTSEPSPGYVYRVVQKFKNNGSGVRGDLAAVVRQILLDGEARGNPADPLKFGKQREPMLRLTGPARAFPTFGYTGTYTQLTGVSANKLRITTSAVNDFSSSFNVSLDFHDQDNNPLTADPDTNPTSTTYGVTATLPIAATHLDISTISPLGSSPTTFTGTEPHGMGANGQTRTIWLFGLSGKFSDAGINSGGKTATVTSPTAFTVPITTTHVFQIASVAIGTPCTVTTVAPHGLPEAPTTTAGVTLNGVTGGVFSGGATSINGTNFTVTKTGANTFTVASSTNVAVACTTAPTGYTTWRQSSNPVRVTTQVPHGLANGDSVTISGVSGGNLSPTINNTFTVSEVAASSFTIAAVSAIAPSTANTGNIVGGNTLEISATGMVNATYTQTQGSATMTVNTAGPQTDVAIPNPTGATTIKSKVYMTVLSRTSALPLTSMAVSNPVQITKVGHGLSNGNTVTISGVTGGGFSSGGVTGLPVINKTHTVTVLTADTFTVPVQCTTIPTAAGTATGTFGSQAADGVYLVQSNGTNTFTVTTADTPTATRTGNVLIPKIPSSHTPTGSLVQYNTNVNHNILVGTPVWVDTAVVQNPVWDAEYTVSVVTDEDHIRTSNQPPNTNGGSYPASGLSANNGTNIWPLVAAPLGRSGNVKVNQSTFSLNSTESTLTQSPLNAPTVFNYFLPYYKFPGVLSNTGLDSPEFQLSTDTNVMNLTNNLTNMFIGTGGGNSNANGLSSFANGVGSVVMSIEPYMTPSKTADAGISALIDELSNLLVGGPLLSATKTEIENFVKGKRITGIATGNPCTVTAPLHGLVNGASVAISGVTGGTFAPTINATYVATVTSANTFTVPVNFSNATGLIVSAAYAPFNFPYTTPTPTNPQMRDRVRAIIHLIITSAEYAVQK